MQHFKNIETENLLDEIQKNQVRTVRLYCGDSKIRMDHSLRVAKILSGNEGHIVEVDCRNPVDVEILSTCMIEKRLDSPDKDYNVYVVHEYQAAAFSVIHDILDKFRENEIPQTVLIFSGESLGNTPAILQALSYWPRALHLNLD